MIYFLSSLPSKTFDAVRNIFTNKKESSTTTAQKGKGKGKSKQCKMIMGSTFKPFRGLDMDIVHDLLYDVGNGVTTLKQAIKKCVDIKALQKVQTAFVQTTQCGDWNAAGSFIHT